MIRSLAVALVCATALAACAPTVDERGNIVSREKLDGVQAGRSTRQDVAALFGSPSSISPLTGSWLYIGGDVLRTPLGFVEDTRQVVAVDFAEDGTVKGMRVLSLDDGLDLSPDATETPAPGDDLPFVRRLFR